MFFLLSRANKDAPSTARRVRAVDADFDPAGWNDHRWGLTPARWELLKGKSFWITGAGTGYGRCMAAALASAGAQVFLTGRRRHRLLEGIEEMRSLSVPVDDCHALEADVTDIREIKAASARVKRLCPSLYGLVNNAALPPSGVEYPIQDETPEYWDAIMRTNVTGPRLLTAEIFPHMATGGAARILFITSEAGWAFTPGVGQYNVSKAALNSLAASSAAEYAARYPGVDIQINALDPGEAKTEMNGSSKASPWRVAGMSLILLSHPRGGPNGRFFHRDGRRLSFTYTREYEKPLE